MISSSTTKKTNGNRNRIADGGVAVTGEPRSARRAHQEHPAAPRPQHVEVNWALRGESLARRFGMDENSLAQRREFIRLGAEERELLMEMAPWAQSIAAQIAKDFYDWQFQFPATREFFEGMTREKKVPLAALRAQLEASQAGYITEVFAGASINWDVRYFDKRLHVGGVHDRINLPFKWYVGSYTEYEALLDEYLHRDFDDEEKIRRVRKAVNKVFNLDLQAIGDSFILSTLYSVLKSAGIDMGAVTQPGDQAEQVGTIKEVFKSNLEGFVSAMNHMAQQHDLGEIDVVIPPAQFQGAFRQMAEGVNSMVSGHITVKKKAMACVAEFGKGNFKATIEKFPGKKAFINDTIEEMRSNLTGLISETSQNTSALASSSEELTAVSQQMAGNAEETATQANVVSAASEQVSKNVSSVASASEQMQVSIREISKNANESARVAKNAVNVAQSTNETVKKLGESSQEIGNVIKVITSIAQQTNLLALNATIEAARAGEAGKGFAVVANEVKELAKQTAKATEEIGQKIEAIQGDTKGAVKAIEDIGTIINQINDISNSTLRRWRSRPSPPTKSAAA